ncbi:MAG: bifunctional oligoribonuclease/PAP phosphatase NrnA [Bacteroidetes bacterium]|nr:bifunctional oligoribonuclease/PAP phosphatase NrnA [Bacteroidota bacterium]
MSNVNSILDLILNSNKIIISTHVSPDADAIGSEVAMALALTQLGKNVQIINSSGYPANLEFLIKHLPQNCYSTVSSKLKTLDADLIIILDTSHRNQFEAFAELMLNTDVKRICIDHHPKSENLFNDKFVDTTIPATGILVYNLISIFPDFKLTKQIAESLYAAIMTDTGSFRFSGTSPLVHEIIAKLIDAGAAPNYIYENIYEMGSTERLHLLGKALQSIKLWNNGKVSVITINKSDFEETGTNVEDLDNVVNFGFTIKGVQVSYLVVQLTESYKISCRSKGNFAANKIAEFFGGGGHLNAAGARYKTNSIDEVLKLLKLKTDEIFNSL